MRNMYNKIHNQDNPFDKRDAPLLSNLHRKGCCVPLMANLQFSAQFPSIHLKKTFRFGYLRLSVRGFACSNMNTIPALGE
jgi:hypothetical protein